jgi:prephenate dehydrogenase
MPSPTYKKIAIVGVGLIGASIGMAVRKRRLAKEVAGIGRRAASLAAAKKVGAVTVATTNLAKGVDGADLVVVCTPVDGIVEHVQAVASVLQGGTSVREGSTRSRREAYECGVLVTDVGSTKAEIVRQIDMAQRDSTWPANVRFIGSHPIAGNEKRGPKHGSADLFVERTVIITPTGDAKREDVRRVKQFWLALGAKVVTLSPAEHDMAVAAVSHLPHLLASAIAGATPARYVGFSGSGWLDTTRIASGDPALWRQILLANRNNVLDALKTFDEQWNEFRKALEAADATALERLLAQAKQIRDAHAGHQATDA